MGAAKLRGVTRSFPLARKGAELLQQQCWVDVEHRMTFSADIVVRVKHASGVFDFEPATREMDKENMQRSVHEQ